MSSSEGGPLRPRRRMARAVMVAAALLLSACTVQPVYGPTPSGGAVGTVLSRIGVDPVDNRVAQEVRNRLIFRLTGGAGGGEAVYRLRLAATTTDVELGVTRVESAPVYSVNVAVTYELTRIATGEIVQRATSRGTASYDRSNQAYANVRARLDAEDRAAAAVADDIHIRLAALAAKGGV